MHIQTGGPAFPRPASEFTKNGTLPDGNKAIDEQDGMTLRDWFAGQALAVIAGFPAVRRDYELDKIEETIGAVQQIAVWAYQIADAMIAERSKKGA